MALVIRLRQQGSKNRQTFRLVVTDRRAPRGGKYVEMLGWYQPLLPNEKNGFVKSDRVQHWLKNGAEITDKAKSLVKRFAPEVLKTS